MSSSVRPLSVSLPTSSLVPEELEDNRFYVYLRDHFDAIFTHSTLVCIPHSRYLEDHCLTRSFVETHCYNASPFFCGQYEAVNGKVIKIEQLILSTVSGFKEQRTVHIISEDSVYIDDKKIRVYMIQLPLEGEPLLYQKRRNTINIPTCRNSKSDLNFLNFFAENAESLVELQSAVQEFVVTYVYIRGFSNYTVEKIQHIYTKAYMTILQRNKLIRDTCRIQAEHEHFLELVENVVMGLLHEKIWVQSLRSILQSKDNYINSICEWYSKDNITLQKYGVSSPISEMPLSCFDQAIACLRRTDATSDTPIYTTYNMNNATSTNISASNDLAFTPLEKIACIKATLDLISAAVDDYVKETNNRTNYNGNMHNEYTKRKNLTNVIIGGGSRFSCYYR
ncbi:hypothetical protein BCR42DRAFT_332462 [Absidia repens]|uniref:Uncharacterized protein n=1 Tax=Absidia repens TaxID=90262 RepID=A0A1X2I8P4_9FUNG|nr:hypothetical protein BCR42DRAFT_332462 [Absidia repens]